jgi:hypothetical protein
MHELLRDHGFWVALAVALAGAAGVALLHRRVRSIGVEAGAVAAIAALVSLTVTERREMLSIAGVAIVFAGAALTRRVPGPFWLVGAVPGAAILAGALHPPVPDWAAVTLFAVVAIVAPCAMAADMGSPRLVPPLLAISAFGMWATTPDTEHTRALLGALVGAAVLFFDRRLRAGPGGNAVIVALMTWASVVDGYPRRGAVVGAVACFGVVVLLPVMGLARVRIRAAPVVIVIGVQLALVLVASRVAGLRQSAFAALAIAACAFIIGALVLLFALRLVSRGSRTGHV